MNLLIQPAVALLHANGQRSVDLLDLLGLELHADERLAIRQHMHKVPSADLSEDTQL